MSENKKTIQKYMEGFVLSDHEMILSCLTDNIMWDMPGYFHLEGKEAFDKEIENENFVGSPTIEVIRMIEENNIVVTEGAVQARMRDGGTLDAVFCDVFHMENGKIKLLTSYLMNKNKA